MSRKSFEITMEDGSQYNVSVRSILNEISEDLIGLSSTVFTYTGEAIEPEVQTDDDIVLDTDYTVEYEDNTEVGTGKVIVTGIGDYTGTVEYEFSIIGIDIRNHITGIEYDTVEYDGTEFEPTVIDDGTVTLDTDYTVTYIGNVNVGIATVTINGIGHYADAVSYTFSITAADIASHITGIDPDTLEYTGTALTPAVVDDGTVTLNTDYNVEYEDNVTPGTGKVIVTGTGNYTGSADFEFTITND